MNMQAIIGSIKLNPVFSNSLTKRLMMMVCVTYKPYVYRPSLLKIFCRLILNVSFSNTIKRSAQQKLKPSMVGSTNSLYLN